MDNNRCFLDKVSDFEKLKYHAANCFDNCTKEKPYVIESVFGENPTEDERLAFAEVHNAHCRYNQLLFPSGPYLYAAPRTQEDYDKLVEKANSGDIYSYLVSAWTMWLQHDYEGAIKLFRYVADFGDSEGFVGLGWLYRRGEGVEADISQAVSFYEQAVLIDGNDQALLELGQYYQSEKSDHEKAFEFYLRSAKQGNAFSMHNVGEYYLNIGEETEGIKWYEKSASYQFFPAYKYVIQYHLDSKSNDIAAFFAKEYLKSNEPMSFAFMGELYIKGLGVEKDIDKGLDYIKKAESMGSDDGDLLLQLARVFIDIDEEKELDYLYKAACLRQQTAEYLYASILFNHDRQAALSLMIDSASQGNKHAQEFLENYGLYR